ncbi:glycosyltransferase family 4 protein [Geobacillus sp. E263]|uniref:glycosyltransferase family 4 protein n=1 Tax=Geobacillus sp. E263 TaxID=391290 RepID=UPI00117B87B5|nr:glycosyltransferase family 4 protein [Geobacillus sp. E263]
MKILHCAESYPPLISGVGKVVQKYAEYFGQKGIESWVATSKKGVMNDYEIINNVHVKRFDITGNDVKRIKGNQQDFIRFIKEQKFDVIVTYAAQTWHFDILKRINKEEIGNPLLLAFPCGFSGLVSFRRPIYYRYFKELPKYLKNFDIIILHSRNYIDYDYIKQNYLGDIWVLPNGVDINEFEMGNSTINAEKLLSSYGINVEKKIVLNVSNHMYAKNHRDFIILANKFPDMEFVQVGLDQKSFGSCYKKCKKKSNEIKNFYSLQLSREELIEVYKKSWVFLLTSRLESFGLVLLESMISMTPFISYDVGVANELNGGFVAQDRKDMARKIRYLLDNEDLYLLKKEQGYLEAREKYSWEYILRNYYEKIINKVGKS